MFFFFNDTATTEIYTLSLHDALPILVEEARSGPPELRGKLAPHFLAVLNTEADEAGLEVIRHGNARVLRARFNDARRSEEHTSELQSHLNLVCRLLLEKKKHTEPNRI